MTKIYSKKKSVKINIGKDSGLKKGGKVCIYQKKKKKKKKKIACGKVRKTKKNSSLVKISNTKRFKKIRKGDQVKYSGLSRRLRGKKKSIVPYSFALRPLYLPYPSSASPASFNMLVYNGAMTDEGGSLWKSDRTYAESENSTILESFGGELEFPGWHLRVGGRYKAFVPYGVDSDYDVTQTNLFAYTLQTGVATGGYIDFPYYTTGAFSIGIGLDLDMTKVVLVMTKVDERAEIKDAVIYTATGASNIASIRIPLRWDPFWLDPIGLSLGLNLLVPLSSFGDTTIFSANDPLHGHKVEDPKLDFSTALDLKPSNYGLEATVGLYLGF